MEPFTIIVAVAASIAVLVVRPGRAAGVVVLSMLLWPEYLRVPMGLAQMSAPRLAGLVLVARMVFSGPLPRWRAADTVVIAWWAWLMLANIFAGSDGTRLANIAGVFFDTVLMYAVGRLALRTTGQLKDMFAPLAICCAVMAATGLMENFFRGSPYSRLLAYHEWAWRQNLEGRFGLMRAIGSTAQPIYFGTAMAMVTAQIFSLRSLVKHRYLWAMACGLGVVATCTSLSAGPLVMLMCLVGCNAFYWMPRMVGPAVLCVILAAAALEMLSNRHFYQLIDYLALDPGNAWYRSRLLEVAVMHLREYWAVGYGDRDIAHWGYDINQMDKVDVVNNYIMHAIQAGLPGLFLYVSLKVLAVKESVRVYRTAAPAVKSVAFAQGAALVALSAAEMSVGLFGAPLLMSFLFVGGLIGGWQAAPIRSTPRIAGGPRAVAARRPVREQATS